MRDAMTPDVLGAIGAPVITTALLARLDFQSGPVFLWTGLDAMQPTGMGDPLLDGNTFDPIAEGIAVEIGENTFTQSGSDELQINLAVPAEMNVALAAAQTYPFEYLTRDATIWRALRIPSADPLAAPVWAIRRVRSGAMYKLEFQFDGSQHNVMLTIESHQSLISNATNQTYLDQSKYDPADTSQNYAVACANGSPAPTAGTVVTPSYGSTAGSVGGSADGGIKLNMPEL